jgi:hypothetical protein
VAPLLWADRLGEPPVLPVPLPEAPDVAPSFSRRAAYALGLAIRGSGAYRRRIAQSALLRPLSEARYESRRSRHASSVPALSGDQTAVLSELRRDGVAVRSIDPPADVVRAADAIIGRIRRRNTDDPWVKASRCEMADHPEAFLWGLSPHLLDLAESYLGLPARYLGMEVKCERVDPTLLGVRNWHLDHEDRSMLKLIVYLSDVDEGSGPFGHVGRTNSVRVRAHVRRQEETLEDDRMQHVVPREDWVQVTGSRLTAVHVDTAQVYHRAFPPTQRERYSVTFAYASTKPSYTYPHLLLRRSVLRRLRSRLTARQWEALRPSRG